jgi:two-component system phosphate regulon sensor histidine kinase PhoR
MDPMKVGIRGRLFLGAVVLTVASMAAGEAYLRPAIERETTERLRADMLTRLTLAADQARAVAVAPGDENRWGALARRLAPLAGGRLTFIAADGRVLGDSEVADNALDTLENHRERPEVATALAGRSDHAVRYSATLKRYLLYVATPVPENTGLVARLSVPLAAVDQALGRVRSILLVAGLVSVGVALLVSTAAVALVARRLRSLMVVAGKMAAGDLSVRTRVQGADEVSELGRTLDHLAGSLSRSLDELREDRDLLGGILESMREGVLVLDSRHRILVVNTSLREMLLLDANLVGRSAIEVIRNADLQKLVEEVLGGQDLARAEIEVGGMKPRRLLINANRLTGEPAGMLLVFTDITEIRRLEQVRRDFAANVSHELRTPIASVCSAAETLRLAMQRDPTAAAPFMDIIERNARRLGDLVEDLLDLSRLESRAWQLKAEPIELGPVFDRVLATHRERAEKKNIKVTMDVPAALTPARGDARAVERAISNLVENAIKYCGDGASVTLSGRNVERGVEISVVDTGPGIEPRHLPRLFERFYRVDPGRSRDMGGTGLGLSIVKHMVEAMGGQVGVDSTPGRGSTFRFSLQKAA